MSSCKANVPDEPLTVIPLMLVILVGVADNAMVTAADPLYDVPVRFVPIVNALVAVAVTVPDPPREMLVPFTVTALFNNFAFAIEPASMVLVTVPVSPVVTNEPEPTIEMPLMLVKLVGVADNAIVTADDPLNDVPVRFEPIVNGCVVVPLVTQLMTPDPFVDNTCPLVPSAEGKVYVVLPAIAAGANPT